MSDSEAEARRRRRATYHTIALVALALTAGRIAVVTGRDTLTAFQSANDRSRWCTIASLVEHGTYAIDQQIAITDPIKRHIHPWQTIDKVRHVDAEGKQRYYSSKPPLFPTVVAGVYWAVNRMTGMTLTEQPIYVGRIILVLVNLPLLAIFFYATIGCIERVGRGDWSRRIAAMGCCFGTMLLPFAISLNNHLPAATATAVAMWVYMVASQRKNSHAKPSPTVPVWMWGLGGMAAALAAANELPALSMTVFWFGLFAWLDRRSVLPFVAGVSVVAIAFFGTNWIAHQSLRPPYAHRGNGPKIALLESSVSEPDDALLQAAGEKIKAAGFSQDVAPALAPSDESDRWILRVDERQFALLSSDTLRSNGQWELRYWDDWYEYPGTYWKDGQRRGVDRGEPSRTTYLAHMTIGHHGLFSLTPLWVLMPIGLILGVASGTAEYRRFAFAVLVATTVCTLFYLNRPLIDRNYGGVSICFRWLLWFAPLWLVVSVPVMHWFRTTSVRRGLLYSLLALSVFSMSASLDSPWQSPWLYQFWQFLGWISV